MYTLKAVLKSYAVTKNANHTIDWNDSYYYHGLVHLAFQKDITFTGW